MPLDIAEIKDMLSGPQSRPVSSRKFVLKESEFEKRITYFDIVQKCNFYTNKYCFKYKGSLFAQNHLYYPSSP